MRGPTPSVPASEGGDDDSASATTGRIWRSMTRYTAADVISPPRAMLAATSSPSITEPSELSAPNSTAASPQVAAWNTIPRAGWRRT